MMGTSGINPDIATAFGASTARASRSPKGEASPGGRFKAMLDRLPPDGQPHAPPGADAWRCASGPAISESAGADGPAESGLATRLPTPEMTVTAFDMHGPVDVTAPPVMPPNTAMANVAPPAMVVGMGPEQARLVEGVARQIVAALDASHKAEPPPGPDAGPARITAGQPALRMQQSALPPPESTIDAAGAGQRAPTALIVTRHETHFAPISPIAGGGPPDRPGRNIRGERADTRQSPTSMGTPVASRQEGIPTPGATISRGTTTFDAIGPTVGPGTTPETAGAAASALPGTSAAGAGDSARADAPPALPRTAPAHTVIGQGPARILHVRLHPAELGTLTVRMRKTDAGLEVHVEASRRETLTLLQRDHERLASLLRHAGDAPDTVTLSLADRATGATQPAGQDGWQQAAPDGRAGTHSGASSGGSHDQGNGAADNPASLHDEYANEEVQDDREATAEAVRPHGALYL